MHEGESGRLPDVGNGRNGAGPNDAVSWGTRRDWLGAATVRACLLSRDARRRELPEAGPEIALRLTKRRFAQGIQCSSRKPRTL
jgi:hypothetical protein